ncbi:MAG: hypothetical protein CJBNEKGG_00222 [Prosthecobacter sp.]|nr:hypothetical protein [Prosthecobacter sp.]
MSFKVLVIPEDPTNNGYILKPLMEAILEDAGKPNAKITVLTNPRLEGYDHALKAIKEDLPDSYGFWDLWVFMPDADRAKPDAMSALETELAAKSVKLLCCPAQPEVEIYACAPYRGEIKGGWEAARQDVHFKEDVFEPLLLAHGDNRRAGAGRDLMIAETLRNRKALYKFCPELAELRDRIAKTIKSE